MFRLAVITLIVVVLYALNREELWNRNARIVKDPPPTQMHE